MIKCPKCAAISSISTQIGGCFGCDDKIFAGHPNDEDRAKDIIKRCRENNISRMELEGIILRFLHSELKDNMNGIKTSYDTVVDFLNKKKFITPCEETSEL
jgi:hypothetical protein